MKLKLERTLATLAGLSIIGAASAQFTIDGSMTDGGYGLPFAVQGNSTGFGNSNLGQVDYANGSELDQLFIGADAENLYIGMAGNLETNYNAFAIFIDSIAGGQNQLVQPQQGVDFGFFNNMAGTSGSGMRFDAGFEADFAFNVKNGNDGNNLYQQLANYVIIGSETGGGYLGSNNRSTTFLSGGDLQNAVELMINNSNTGGVGDNNGLAWQLGGVDSGAGVTTGAEMKIPFSMLGNEACDVKIMVALTGGGGEYFSNQVLGSLDGTYGNLGFIVGNAPSLDFSTIAGNQYVTVLPSTSGTIMFDGVGDINLAPTEINVRYYQNGELVMSKNIVRGPNGEFKVCGPVRGGAYTLLVDADGFLARAVASDTSNGAVNVGTVVLLNGDIDNDGEVGPGDFSILATAFLSADGDPNWNAAADLDRDGEVGPGDFSILANNFLLADDAP